MASRWPQALAVAAELALVLAAILALSSATAALATLGALVAPQVFRHVPAPHNALAMTRIFRNYDSFALVCALIALLAELLLAWLRPSFLKRDALRVLCLCVYVVGVAAQATFVTPSIANLSAQWRADGATNPGTTATLKLGAVHRQASALGQAQALLALGVIGLAFTRKRREVAAAS
jgi:Domain of unknown function (DUF4149)